MGSLCTDVGEHLSHRRGATRRTSLWRSRASIASRISVSGIRISPHPGKHEWNPRAPCPRTSVFFRPAPRRAQGKTSWRGASRAPRLSESALACPVRRGASANVAVRGDASKGSRVGLDARRPQIEPKSVPHRPSVDPGPQMSTLSCIQALQGHRGSTSTERAVVPRWRAMVVSVGFRLRRRFGQELVGRPGHHGHTSFGAPASPCVATCACHSRPRRRRRTERGSTRQAPNGAEGRWAIWP